MTSLHVFGIHLVLKKWNHIKQTWNRTKQNKAWTLCIVRKVQESYERGKHVDVRIGEEKQEDKKLTICQTPTLIFHNSDFQ